MGASLFRDLGDLFPTGLVEGSVVQLPFTGIMVILSSSYLTIRLKVDEFHHCDYLVIEIRHEYIVDRVVSIFTLQLCTVLLTFQMNKYIPLIWLSNLQQM